MDCETLWSQEGQSSGALSDGLLADFKACCSCPPTQNFHVCCRWGNRWSLEREDLLAARHKDPQFMARLTPRTKERITAKAAEPSQFAAEFERPLGQLDLFGSPSLKP